VDEIPIKGNKQGFCKYKSHLKTENLYKGLLSFMHKQADFDIQQQQKFQQRKFTSNCSLDQILLHCQANIQ
jgi:hypothetical protein